MGAVKARTNPIQRDTNTGTATLLNHRTKGGEEVFHVFPSHIRTGGPLDNLIQRSLVFLVHTDMVPCRGTTVK